jgi:hypothetical protein
MAVRIDTITMDCRDDRMLSAFWTVVLGYQVAVDQPGDWVMPEPKVVRNRVHLDLIPTEGELETEIWQLESLGARRVRYVENDPDESHRIMADPEGNELCCE